MVHLGAHLAGEVYPDDLQLEKKGWKPLYAYKRDKALTRIVSKVKSLGSAHSCVQR